MEIIYEVARAIEEAGGFCWNRLRSTGNQPRHVEVAWGLAKGYFNMPRMISNGQRYTSEIIIWGKAENYLLKYSSMSWANMKFAKALAVVYYLLTRNQDKYFTKYELVLIVGKCYFIFVAWGYLKFWVFQVPLVFDTRGYLEFRVTQVPLDTRTEVGTDSVLRCSSVLGPNSVSAFLSWPEDSAWKQEPTGIGIF